MSSWSILLKPWPFMSQNSAPTADGGPNEDAASQCGPTCLAMVIDYLTGVTIDPDTIKDIILGQGAAGITSARELTQFLSQYASTGSITYSPTTEQGNGSFTNLIWAYTVVGKPVIALFKYSATDPTLHWRCCIGIDPTTVTMADPWTGAQLVQTYDQAFSLFAGSLIGIERARDSQL